MKQLATSYSFNASAKTVTLTGLNVPLNYVLLIVNATRNAIIYNLADPATGAQSYTQGANSVITLKVDLSGMSDTDQLTIFFDDGKESALIAVQGPKGEDGAAGTDGADGADALWDFTGAYHPGLSYAVGSVTTYDGETWYRINDNGGNVGDTPSEGVFWTKIAQKGAGEITHASQHAVGGSDPLTPADIGASATGHTHSAADIVEFATQDAGTGNAWTPVDANEVAGRANDAYHSSQDNYWMIDNLTPADIGAEPAITALPIDKGGTGATDEATARANLGLGMPADVQIFRIAGAYTWTKPNPNSAKKVRVELVGGGGGGGSGRKGAVGSARYGGGGGGAGAVTICEFDASTLPNTAISGIIGLGGGGGAGRLIASDGENGIDGTATTFGSYLRASGGSSGKKGTSGQGMGGGSQPNGLYAGGAGSSSNPSSVPSTPVGTFTSGGGAGGGIDTLGNVRAGALGGQVIVSSLAGAGAGQPGAILPVSTIGFGGGGGDASPIGHAMAGGSGGYYGGGGGGGGAATGNVDIGNSGSGGEGASGIAIITTYF
jgi:hypothetical protein